MRRALDRLGRAQRRRAPLRALLAAAERVPGWGSLPYWVRLHLRALAAPGRIWGALPAGAERIVLMASHELTASGAPRLLLEVARACRARGWGVVVVSPADGPFREPLVEAGATVVATPSALSRRSPVFALAPLADALLCNTLITLDLVRRRPAAPTIWYLHETGLINEIGRDADVRAAVEAADAIWASSPLVARHIARFGAEARVVGGTGAPAPASAPVGRHSPLRALVLGGFEPRKGQLALAQAYTSLDAAERAMLTILFHGRVLDADYHARFRDALVPGLVDGGLLTPPAAAASLGRADAALVPSVDEPLSLVAIDAMAAGRVVLCTGACGIADHLADGESAFIAEDASVAALAALLRRALRERERWAVIGAAGQAVWRERFAPDVYAARVTSAMEAAMRPVPVALSPAMRHPAPERADR